MSERSHIFTGIGTALVDYKVINPTQPLPTSHEAVPAFLSIQNEVRKNAGGSMATAMVTLSELMPPGNVNFLQRIGLDSDGDFFREQTPIELRRGIQTDISNPTGVCVFAVSEGGQKIDQWPEVTFYGASDDLEIPKGTGQGGDVFVTNVNAYRRLSPKGEIVNALREVVDSDSIFVLRLSGIQHGTDEKFDKKELDDLLDTLPKSPDIIFANAVELIHTSGIADVEEAIRHAFPESKLMVITNGAKGSLVRLNDKVLTIPPESVSREDVKDTTGAGDCYMGVMLAALFSRPTDQWTEDFVTSCAGIGTYASSLVIQSFDSRLTTDQLHDIRDRITAMNARYQVEETIHGDRTGVDDHNGHTQFL